MKSYKESSWSKTYKTRAACISRLIQKVLVVYGVKQVDLAKQLAVNHTTFSSWARGNSAPNHIDEFRRVRAELKYLISNIDVGPAGVKPQLPGRGSVTLEDLTKTPIMEQVEGEPRWATIPPVEHLPSALDIQIGGGHYKNRAIQPVQYIEANKLGFLEGCVVKRVTRHDEPTGKGREDIEKAIHELQLLLEMRYPEGELI